MITSYPVVKLAFSSFDLSRTIAHETLRRVFIVFTLRFLNLAVVTESERLYIIPRKLTDSKKSLPSRVVSLVGWERSSSMTVKTVEDKS